MPALVTTLGLKFASELGFILPHEHVFANFYADDDANADVEQVLSKLQPELSRAKSTGLTCLVDATAIGGARRIDIIQAVSEAHQLPIVAATGIFKEPHKAQWVAEKGEDGLVAWMTQELTKGIAGSGICAGWIKLSVADNGIADHEQILLRAAARAGRQTGATIGVHTVSGRVALDQLNIIEDASYSPERFIWIHTQVEKDVQLHLEVAKRGAWLEYDAIGVDRPDEEYIELIQRILDAGYGNQLLLSHDRNGYNPHESDGGEIQSYTYLSDSLLPKLRAVGMDEATIQQLTHTNPFRAYAR